MKATIELPDLPDGWEVVGNIAPKKGMMFLGVWNKWCIAEINLDGAFFITARRKQTLADWANEQPDLQAYARLFPNANWTFLCTESSWEKCAIKFPKAPCAGAIRTKNGKWVNA
jgi:hypothetical protein